MPSFGGRRDQTRERSFEGTRGEETRLEKECGWDVFDCCDKVLGRDISKRPHKPKATRQRVHTVVYVNSIVSRSNESSLTSPYPFKRLMSDLVQYSQ